MENKSRNIKIFLVVFLVLVSLILGGLFIKISWKTQPTKREQSNPELTNETSGVVINSDINNFIVDNLGKKMDEAEFIKQLQSCGVVGPKNIKIDKNTSINDLFTEFKTGEEKKVVLFNAANERLNTGGGGLNRGLSEYARVNDGIESTSKDDEVWKKLKDLDGNRIRPNKKEYPVGTLAFSEFKDGYILHIVGPKRSETNNLGIKTTDDLLNFMKDIYLKSLRSIIDKKNIKFILMARVSTDIFAKLGEKGKNTMFEEEEFKTVCNLGFLYAVAVIDSELKSEGKRNEYVLALNF